MHHSCVVAAKSAEAEHRIPARLEHFVEAWLGFEPDEVVLHRVGKGLWAFSASVAAAQLGIVSPVHIAAREVCLIGGLPTFERFPQYAPSAQMRPAAWIGELMRTHPLSDLYRSLGGAFSAVRASPEEVVGVGSFCGYESLFHLDNDEYVAVGNRAALVAAFQPSAPNSATDARALSWVPATTMILGTDTPWRGVRRLQTDQTLSIRDQRLTTRPVDKPVWSSLDHSDDIAVSYDLAIQGLVERFEWYLRTGVSFGAHLTGGKDSRLILALLLATGAVEQVGEIVTHGSEANGDVVVARQIAARIGLENHVVREGAKPAVRKAEWREHQQRFRYSPWKYDMYLTPYDGRGEPKTEQTTQTLFMGGGGELIRQKGIAPDASADSVESIVDRFTNWYYRHDALGLLAADARAWQRDWIRTTVEDLIGTGAVNLQQSFYIEQRMANWGNAHMCNNSASSVPVLVDFDLARLMHQRADMADELPYEILTRCAPQLRGLPFFNDAWSGRTAERAEADGTLRPPVSAAVTESFPWQFALYREHRDELLRACMPSLSAWEGLVPAEHVERLLTEPVEPFDSAHVKMLFGLLAATNYLTGELSAERDLAATTGRPRIAGSEAAVARSWFPHRGYSKREMPKRTEPIHLRDPVERVWSLYRDREGAVGRAIEERGWSLADVYLELGGGGPGSSELHRRFGELFNGQARAALATQGDESKLEYWAGIPERAAALRDEAREILAAQPSVEVGDDGSAGGPDPQTRVLILAHNQIDAELHAHFAATLERDRPPTRRQPAQRRSTAVCVLGMSRSGTSVTARVLDILGVDLGSEDELMAPATANNPAGFWEHQGIADLNEDILATLGEAPRQRWRWPPPLDPGWERDPRLDRHREAARSILLESFAGSRLWGWKDPRTCLTLPFWQRLLEETQEVESDLRYVICVRDPRDVAASLAARDSMPEGETFGLWLRYMTDALAHTDGRPRTFVSYEGYFPDWAAQAGRLARFLDLPEPDELDRAAIASHLDEGLRHHRHGDRPGDSPGLPARVADLYARLTELCEP